jgi:hypothetical protein
MDHKSDHEANQKAITLIEEDLKSEIRLKEFNKHEMQHKFEMA